MVDMAETGAGAPRKRLHLGRLGWTALVAGVAMTSSLLGLAFDIHPSWRPDPGTNLGATISIFDVEPRVTYAEYAQRLATSDKDKLRLEAVACGHEPPCGLLNSYGEVVYVQTDVQGFKRKHVSMRASLYRAGDRAIVPGSTRPVADERLDSPSDRAVVPIWLGCPNGGSHPFFVRVQLYNKGDHVLLAIADSKPFKGHCDEG
jgi:hypothetical protein